jgi:hypothetical protein
MSLTKPPLTELSIERGTQDLINEWLALWFDGQRHAVGANDPVLFPNVYRKFGQSKTAQPLKDDDASREAVEIRLVILPRQNVRHANDSVLASGKLAIKYVLFNFWVKAKAPGPDQSEALAQRTADLLQAILDNPAARYLLAEKGIEHLHPNLPQPVPMADWAARLVSCAAQLIHPIKIGAPVNPVPNADQQDVIYYNESPLLVGEYLMGTYQWSARAQLLGVTLNGWPAQGQDVVLGLEEAGQMTGTTVTFPAGVANEDAEATADFTNLFVNPNRSVRWKVLSAPDPETSAWHLSLNLRVQPLG